MNYTEIRARVVSLVHGRDSKGSWLLPYKHDDHCVWCGRLTKFVGELLEEDRKTWKLHNDSEIRFV